jgi:hypothetical protein
MVERSNNMERLTKRDSNGMAVFADDELAKDCDVSGRVGRYWEKILNKLALHEDAEELGLMIILPSETVYEPTWDAGEKCDLVCPECFDCDENSYPCYRCEKSELFVYERICEQKHLDRVGMTVFLTSEEAEVVVEDMRKQKLL